MLCRGRAITTRADRFCSPSVAGAGFNPDMGSSAVRKPPSTQPPHVRVANPVRSARTREKLMRATIECLHELSYDRTSTVLVTRRAGVSRGAMLHQFPSKADLMMAASDYIRLQRRAAHEAALEGIHDPLEQLRRTVDITWSELSKPSGVARIEIMLASR